MTSSKSATEHGTEWAFNLFRPILKDLHLQSFDNNSYLRTSLKKYGLVKHNMARCVIVPVRYKFTNPNYKGVFVWTYNKKKDMYILYIVINENLYGDNLKHEECVKRKLITTHEFTHCTAAMLSLSGIVSEQLIESLQKNMRKNVDVIQSVDVDGIMSEYTKEVKDVSVSDKTDLSIRKFDDDHFRTGYENFTGSYYDLNTDYLFSRQLFEEYFDKNKMQLFKDLIKQGANTEAATLLARATEDVITQKYLDKDFVVEKIKTTIVPDYVKEVAKYVKAKK